jgi:phosphinothricin acetyltransferase
VRTRKHPEECTVRIRDALPSDLATISAIYNREVEVGTATFDTEPRSEAAQREWFEAHQAPAHPVLVAEDDGRVVAWASLSPWSERAGYSRTVEGSLFVAADHQGRGLGKALTAALVERARAAGHRVLIARIEAANEPSRTLLRRAGYRSVGVMHEVGEKLGRVLDVEIFELLL